MPQLLKIIDALQTHSRALDGSKAAVRSRLLRQAARASCAAIAPGALLAYHESLLFMAAFPYSAAEQRMTERLLKSLAACVGRRAVDDARFRRGIAESGVAGSVVTLKPSLDLLRWAVSRWPDNIQDNIQIVWRDDSPGDGFDQIVDALVTPCEFDGLFHPRFSMRQWIDIARGDASEARWIAERFARACERANLPTTLRDSLFDRMELEVRLHVHAAGDSRSLCRFPLRPLFAHATHAPKPMPVDAILDAPLPRVDRPPRRDAERLIDMARCALAVRGRETDPITYANPNDVVLHRLDRGVDVLLLGLQPARRLPLEGFVGYVAAKNRVPIAYGGGWMLFDQCTIGINIFDTFRGGESMHTFAQILRVYRHAFGIRSFSVDPFQFGQDNEEAIASGAFWFYWRAGFRPVEADLLAVAEHEAARLADNASHRTAPRILRRLATGRMRRTVGELSDLPFIDPCEVALAVSGSLAGLVGAEFDQARRRRAQRVTNALQLDDRDVAVVEHFADLLGMIDDLPKWPAADRRALRQVIRAKLGRSEFDYLHRLRGHHRFRRALARIARDSPAQSPGER